MGHDHPHGPHDHPHDHADQPTEVEGSWRDEADDHPVSVSRRRFLSRAAGLAATAGAASLAGAIPAAAAPAPTNPYTEQRWYAGDHHIHTYFSGDGTYDVATHAEQATKFGLSWMVITDHGGTAHQKLSIDQITPTIEDARKRNGDLKIYQGLEWNIPGAEHATVFLPPGKRTVDILRAFEAAYDGGVLTDLGLIQRPVSADGEPYALLALRYLEAQVLSGNTDIALMFANHPARRGLDSPHELRGWRDAAPGVAVGMEGAPGHQAAGISKAAGGAGGARGFYDKAPDADGFPGYEPNELENPYRTYGGFDFLTAKVGGVWDSLLAEGRPWWVTATSDSHAVFQDTRLAGKQDYNATGSRGAPTDSGVSQAYGDFWPGYYSATLVGAKSKSYVDIMRGLQSGQIVAVHGRLIDGLDVRVRATGDGDRRGVGLGGRTWVARGGDVEVTITVTLPNGPNFSGQQAALSHVQLISGPVTGPVADRDTMTAPQTAVVETFEVGAADAGKQVTFTHVFSGVQQAFYVRLRGGDGRRVDADGGPLMDVGGDADPWADLWFYANPVFVDVV